MKTINKGLRALTTSKERQEIRAVGSQGIAEWLVKAKPGEIVEINGVTLRRSFDQKWLDGSVTRFARVIAPATHKNYESDLSLEGLKEWGIL